MHFIYCVTRINVEEKFDYIDILYSLSVGYFSFFINKVVNHDTSNFNLGIASLDGTFNFVFMIEKNINLRLSYVMLLFGFGLLVIYSKNSYHTIKNIDDISNENIYERHNHHEEIELDKIRAY